MVHLKDRIKRFPGTCDFDRMYAGTGCGEPSPQQAELSLPDCLAKCRDIPIQPGGIF